MSSAVLEQEQVHQQQQVGTQGQVYCYSCTHTVGATVTVVPDFVYRKSTWIVIAGQKCPRCAASLDAALVLEAK